MNKILSRLFSFLKYILLIFAFAITFFGIINTYKRLEKSLVESIPLFIPFFVLFVLFIINIFAKKAKIKDNLLFNFTCVLFFIVVIIIGLRAKFDVNMVIYHKYKIGYNPMYFADNLASLKIILYCLSVSNIFLLLKAAFEKNDKKSKTEKVVLEEKTVMSEEL